MRVPAAAVLMLGLAAACSSPFGRQYEYEEQLYLGVDGSADVTINTSLPALASLRGLSLDPAIDRDGLRAEVAKAGCANPRVGRPWMRRGRRFAQIRLSVDDVRRLRECRLLSWSSYTFEVQEGVILFTQTVGAAAGVDAGPVNWDGGEIVGFKLHVPSRIVFHNVKRLEDGSNGAPERGNILAWEQYLTDRRASRPLRMEVRMDSRSILFHAVRLFLGALAAAIALIAGTVWLVVRRARRRLRSG
jgi:hypothetical protein